MWSARRCRCVWLTVTLCRCPGATGQAWNFRLNTTGLNPPELYELAVKKGMKTAEIPTIPELDVWK